MHNPIFTPTRCPICLVRINRCGIANHIRSHFKSGTIGNRSRDWWSGWIEGFARGVREGREEERKLLAQRRLHR